jgi:DNA-binding LytR/AlgR family response regulator
LATREKSTINLTICEDEPATRALLTRLTKEWASSRIRSVCISSYENAESFLFHYEDDKSADILLLDIQMGPMDGMTLAKTIRKDNNNVQIIFITAISDYIAEGYDVSAVHYLLKPIKGEKLHTALDKAAANLSQPKRTITLDTAEGIAIIPIDTITHIEALDHDLLINQQTGTVSCKMPLYKLEETLSDTRFVKIHRSYLVNLAYVKRITRTDIILDNGKTLPLSRRLYKEVNAALMRYVTGMAQ